MCAAAFWLHPDYLSHLPQALTDSKKLSAKQRTVIEAGLSQPPHLFDTAFATVDEIDDIGILQATFLAMQRAVSSVCETLLSTDPLGFANNAHHPSKDHLIAHILVDGNLLPPLSLTSPLPATAIIKGDSKSLSIAAASIMAKQRRDKYMVTLSQTCPDYGWDSNQGYGTAAHQKALALYGVTPHHRRSFKPIAKLLDHTD